MKKRKLRDSQLSSCKRRKRFYHLLASSTKDVDADPSSPIPPSPTEMKQLIIRLQQLRENSEIEKDDGHGSLLLKKTATEVTMRKNGRSLHAVTEKNQKYVESRELLELLNNNLIELSPYNFDLAKISYHPSQAFEIGFELFSNIVHLESVLELGLQSFSKFLMDDALRKFAKQFGFNCSGGGRYQIPYLIATAGNLGVGLSTRLHSDLDIIFDDKDILEKCLPKQTLLYCLVYEVKKAAVPTRKGKTHPLIEDHLDFKKILAVLRSIIRTYAVGLQMSPKDLESICVWGVLQSSNQLWFLKCKPRLCKEKEEDKKFSIVYEVLYNEKPLMISVRKHALKAAEVFHKIMYDAKRTAKVLKSFTPSSENEYNNTSKSSEKLHEYKITLMTEEFIDFWQTLKEKNFRSIKRLNDKHKQSVMNLIAKQQGWIFQKFERVKDEASLYVFANSMLSFCYLFCDNELKQVVPLELGDNRQRQCDTAKVFFINLLNDINDSTKPYIFCCATFTIPPKRDIDVEVADIDDKDEDYKPEDSEDGDDNHDYDFEFFDNANNGSQEAAAVNNNQKGGSKEKNSARQKTLSDCEAQDPTILLHPSGISWKQRLENAMKEFLTDDEYRRVEQKYTYSYGIYFYLYNLPWEFIKVTIAYKEVESVFIMTQLEQEKLKHKNLLTVYDYRIMFENESRVIAATRSEALRCYKNFIQKKYFVSNNKNLLQWIWKNIIIASLDGLEYLHSNQIIHGDISEGNILFGEGDEADYYAVICDLNSSIPFSVLDDEVPLKHRLEIPVGTVGYYPYQESKPSVFTDCYGLISVVCTFVFFGLFGTVDSFGKNKKLMHEQLRKIL